MARLLVVGSSNTDLSLSLPRLPSAGQTVIGKSLLTGPGGKGANQAVAAARAGGDVVLVTRVGDDTFGRRSLRLYQDEGIDVTHAKALEGASSGVALIFVGDDGENMIGVAPGANALLAADDIGGLPDDLFGTGRVLLVAGLEVPLKAVERAVERASKAGMRVVMNPAPFHEDLLASGILRGADVVTPNRVELGQLTGMATGTNDEVVAAARTLGASGAPAGVVVTLGAAGCLVVHEGRVEAIRPHAVRALDTVGAGDAFSGALAVALAEGKPLFEAARWATAASALAVRRSGAEDALPYRTEIDRLVDDRDRTP